MLPVQGSVRCARPTEYILAHFQVKMMHMTISFTSFTPANYDEMFSEWLYWYDRSVLLAALLSLLGGQLPPLL